MRATALPVETRLIVYERPGEQVELEALAHEAGVHPELVRRLVAIGLLDPPAGSSVNRRAFRRDTAAQIARAVRLRNDLGLDYAGALLACDLLDRIEKLELRLKGQQAADRARR